MTDAETCSLDQLADALTRRGVRYVLLGDDTGLGGLNFSSSKPEVWTLGALDIARRMAERALMQEIDQSKIKTIFPQDPDAN